jgi:hypothetical protein
MRDGIKDEVIVRRCVGNFKRKAETLHDIHDTLNFESTILFLLEFSLLPQADDEITLILS